MMRKVDTDRITRLHSMYGDTYLYDESKFTDMSTPVNVTCIQHGDFQISLTSFLQRGCTKCGRSITASKLRKVYTNSWYREKLMELTNSTLTIDSKEDIYGQIKISHKCLVCYHKWLVKPEDILNGRRCSSKSCQYKRVAEKRTRTTDEIQKRLFEKHGNRIELLGEFKPNEKTIFLCNVCSKTWTTRSYENVFRGSGCPHCIPKGYSKIAIEWIEKEVYSRRMKNVKHFLNGGEFCIPGTRIRVDGYHERTKTIFEFYGDAYHGNPDVYKSRSKPHPFNDKTAQRLYKDTVKREEYLKSLGYRIISIWERDYRIKTKT